MKIKALIYFITFSGITIATCGSLQSCNPINAKYLEGKQQTNDSITISYLQQAILLNGDAIEVRMNKEFLLTDSNNKEHPLGTLINDNKIIYKFSENNCMQCVEKYIPFINEFIKRYGKDRVFIIGSYSKAENLFLTLKKHKLLGMNIYNLPPSYLQSEKIETVNSPYVFVLSPDFEVSDVFIPQKEIPQLSSYYQENLVLN